MNLSARRLVASFTLACFVLQPGITTAQLAADPRAVSGTRPVVEAAANGVPLVQIAPASGAGVSRNQFTHYNVDPRGVVLNNATAAARTQQAGWVDANPHLAGRAARVILNEVTGADPSRLHGYTEVGGQRAEVVIANPNGITCNGCGFINASRGVLSTGSPVIGPDGGLAALQVAGGTLTIEGQGLNAANIDRLDLIARAVALNASIWANQLNVVAGVDRVDYPGLVVTPGGAGGSPAGVAIDVAALGGMYANRIRLVGTEAGVGVNSRGTIAASGGDLTITSEGRVVLGGATSAAVNVAVEGRHGIVQSGTAYAGGSARFATGEVLENSGVIAAGADLALAGRTVSQKGTAAAGSDSAGTVGTRGALSIDAEEVALASGRNLAGARVSIAGAAVELAGARTSTAGDVTLLARAGDIDHRGATLQVGGTATLRAAAALRNDAGAAESGGKLDIEASSVANAAGRIASAGAGDVRVRAAGTVDNRGGLLGANGAVEVVADVLDNSAGTVVAGQGLAVRASRVVNMRGSIGARGDAQLSAQELSNEQGTLVARGALAVDVAASLDNRSGALSAGRAIRIAAGALDNRDGVIESGQATSAAIGGALHNDAGRIVAERFELRAQSISNRAGTLYAAADGSVAADRLDNAGGAIATGGSLVAATRSVANAGGLVSANVDVRLATESFGGGEVLAGRDLSVEIAGDLAHPAGARLQAERDLRITTIGTTANAGTLAARGAVEVDARSITNDASGTIAGSAVALAAREGLVNRGRIDGDVVAIRSATVDNVASIFGGAILIEADRVANVGPAATIAAAGDARLLARSVVENRDGATVFAGGDLSIAADAARNRAAEVVNRSSQIEAAGNLEIHADRLENSAGFAVENVLVSEVTLPHYVAIHDKWPAVAPYGTNLADPTTLFMYHPVRGYERERDVTRRTTEDRLLAAAPPAKLLAGGTMTIRAGTLVNEASRIAAGGLLDTSATTAITNVGRDLQRRDAIATRHWECVDYYKYSCRSGWVITDSNTELAQQTGAVRSTIESATAISLSAPAIANVEPNPEGAPAGRVASTLPPGVPFPAALAGTGAAVPAGNPVAAGLTLPAGGLFRVRSEPGHPYLVETDPRFAEFAQFVSSDYMLARLGLDPGRIGKRLGDGFYESRLAREEIYRLTGRRFLAGYTSDRDQFVALMDNAIPYAGKLELAVGVALSPEQVAALTHDIVWLVEETVQDQRVLVPVVYLARTRPGDVAPDGALIAAEDIELRAGGDLVNTGAVRGRRSLLAAGFDVTNRGGVLAGGEGAVVRAERDLSNQSGAIEGGDVRLAAGRDLRIETRTQRVQGLQSFTTRVDEQARVVAERSLAVTAGRDVTLAGAAVQSGGDAALAAGRDLGVGTAVHREGSETGAASLQSRALAERQIGSRVGAGGDLALSAGRDLQLTAAAASAGRDASLAAGRDVSIGAATDRIATAGSARAPRFAHDWRQVDETTVGSSVQAGRDVTVGSESGKALVEGSRLGAGSGALTLSVPGDITVRAGVERDESYSYLSMERRGFLSRRTTENRALEATALATPSTLSGETVMLQAGGGIDVRGSNVVGVGDVRIRAGGDVGVAGVAQQSTSERYQAERRSGFLGSGGGIGLSFGRQSQSIDQGTVTTMTAPSTIGSASGRVAVEAAGDYRQRGSDVMGGAGVSISARNVAIEAAEERTDFRYLREYKRSGFTLALSGTGITPLTLAADSVKRANDVQDDRLKALYAFRAARLAAQGVAEAADYLSGRGPGFVGISLSYGTAQTTAEQQIASTVARPSTVLSAGDVEVRARTGDLGVTGSTVSGQNVTLSAANDVILRSAENRTTSRSDQTGRTSQGGVGVGWSATGGVGVTVFGSTSRGEASFERSTVTHTEAQVGAVETLTVRSGRDTTLAGAQARGERIEVEVGRNLAIESQQDTDTYRGRQSASGGGASITFGPAGVTGGSASGFGQRGRTDSDYASVQEPSGLFAGGRGFGLDVAGNTDLRGGQIASTAPAERNRLSTGTLTFSDIDNRASYEATGSGGGISVGVAADGKAGGSIAPAIVPTQSDEQRSTTVAAVAPGTIEIRRPGTQPQPVSALSRTPQTQSEPLQNRFDPQKVAENQELAAVFGQEAFWLVGTYAQSRVRAHQQARTRNDDSEAALREARRAAERVTTQEERQRAEALVQRAEEQAAKTAAEVAASQADYELWKDGGAGKVVLHAIAGALMAKLGGGSVVAGALAGGLNEAAVPEVTRIGREAGLSDEAIRAVLPVASALVGAAAGAASGSAATGAGVAAAGTLNNHLSHIEDAKRREELAACAQRHDAAACMAERERFWKEISDANRQAVFECGDFWACSGLGGEADRARHYFERARAACDTSQCRAYYTQQIQEATEASIVAMRRRSAGGWAGDLAADGAGIALTGVTAATVVGARASGGTGGAAAAGRGTAPAPRVDASLVFRGKTVEPDIAVALNALPDSFPRELGRAIEYEAYRYSDPRFPMLGTRPDGNYRFANATTQGRDIDRDVHFGPDELTVRLEVRLNHDGKNFDIVGVRMDNILDLTNPNVRSALNLDSSLLAARVEVKKTVYAYTQEVGRLAYGAGYQGILYPSAQRPGHSNLILFGDRYDPTGIELLHHSKASR